MSTTSLGRWSCGETSLPDVASITQVNVYDFDNTLFRTPLPSRAVWEGPSIGLLQGYDVFAGGGWWHDPSLLAAVGGGVEQMEPVAWDGWWEEHVVESARKSIATPNHLTVLMTGRAQSRYTELVQKILRSKGLHFDLVVLKPDVCPTGEVPSSTGAYKTIFFHSVMSTYSQATQLDIYEDRPKQAKEFSEYLEEWNAALSSSSSPARPKFSWHIELIEPTSLAYEPQDEIASVSRMINAHNAAIAVGKLGHGAKTYKFETSRKYTGYLIAPVDTTKLKTLLQPPQSVQPDNIRALADNIMLSFSPPKQSVLSRAGGIGAKQEWRTVSVGNYNDKIWAARVEPLDESRPHPSDRDPFVILGHVPGVKTSDARQITNWTPIPPEKQIVFTTEVGDKALVRIVQGTADSKPKPYDNKKRARPQYVDQSSADDSENPRQQKSHGNQFAARGRGRGGAAFGNARPNRNGPPQGPRYGGGGGGGGGRGGRGGRGRGGQYRSLDDAGQNGYGDAGGMQY